MSLSYMTVADVLPPDNLQLRAQISRESETTAAHAPHSAASSTQTLSPPLPSQPSSRQLQDDALGEFFGGRSHRTRTRQPDRRIPPPYSPDWDGEKLPVYSVTPPDAEPDTMARHLFKYGFLFPFFWLVGVYLLFAPMRVSDDWQSDRTMEDKEKILSEMRTAERKWAKRCLWAFLLFIAGLAIVVAVVVVAVRRRS